MAKSGLSISNPVIGQLYTEKRILLSRQKFATPESDLIKTVATKCSAIIRYQFDFNKPQSILVPHFLNNTRT